MLMRLPHNLIGNAAFMFADTDVLIASIGLPKESPEAGLIRYYLAVGLPPVTSNPTLATMLGLNEGFVWSLVNRTHRHYRHFELPKGRKGTRRIHAPRVGLKIVQTWLAYHFQNLWPHHDNAYGFVRGRSHLHAAAQHLGAEWVVSTDIENFFPSIKIDRVHHAIQMLGYNDPESIQLILSLCCLGGALTQGAPTSPVLSNIVLDDLDRKLSGYAVSNNYTYTRYADDLVISGRGGKPGRVLYTMEEFLATNGWNIAKHKSSIDRAPGRLKVHGLLVHGKEIRLTKGYRNRIRAYRYLIQKDAVRDEDLDRIKGHLEFARSVDVFNERRRGG